MVVMRRILLVEDEVEIQILVEHILRAEGYEVHSTGTVKSALYLLDDRPFDLVVSDGKLPDGTGMTVCDKASAKGIKTLIITGYAFQFPKEQLSRFRYLLKPVRPPELIKAVDDELARNGNATPVPS
jgi:CheY-like chemotaxis protein